MLLSSCPASSCFPRSDGVSPEGTRRNPSGLGLGFRLCLALWDSKGVNLRPRHAKLEVILLSCIPESCRVCQNFSCLQRVEGTATYHHLLRCFTNNTTASTTSAKTLATTTATSSTPNSSDRDRAYSPHVHGTSFAWTRVILSICGWYAITSCWIPWTCRERNDHHPNDAEARTRAWRSKLLAYYKHQQ